MQYKQEKEVELWWNFRKKEKEIEFRRQEVAFKGLPDIPRLK